MDPLLKGYFEKFLESHELERPKGAAIDDADKMSGLYERFINYHLFSEDTPEIFTADSELLDFVCPGGEGDAKLDGFGILVQGRLVRNKEEILNIIDTIKKIEVEFVAIQTKMRPRFETTEFLAFGTTLRKFFSSNPPVLNDNLKELFELKDFIYTDKKVIKALQCNPKLSAYYVTIGQFKEDDHYKSAKDTIVSMFSDGESRGDYIEKFDISVIDAKETRKKIESLENNYDVSLIINKSMNLTVGSNDKIKKAVSFTCTGKEFLKLLTNDNGTLRRSLFNDNVRDYLGAGSVNREIEDTMINDPELFLLCNNGVTIVSSNFEPIKDDLVKIINPQIVNGCQTSNTLYKLRDKIEQDKLMLSVRVICTDDNDISNKVVRSTNRQNQVLEEAFETTKPFHQSIEKHFAFTTSPVKIYYERRSKQYANDESIYKTHIVNLRVLTHVFVAAILRRPHEAHRHEAKLLEIYGRDNRRIFCEDHDVEIYYYCALLYYRVEEALRTNPYYKKNKWMKKFRGHFYFIISSILNKDIPKLSSTSKDYKKMINRFSENLSDAEKFMSLMIKAGEILNSTSNRWSKEGHSRYGMKDNQEFTSMLLNEIQKFKSNPEISQSSSDASSSTIQRHRKYLGKRKYTNNK